MKKRVFSLLLALVLALSAAALPASAAGSFSDVSDKKTAQNVEVLRLLGVVDGNGAGQFNPNGQLTRAEFCKMVVVLMGKGDDAVQYSTVTIFPDVRATHWAAGYINLAVRQSEPKLLAGLPDGTFQPDRAITYGEAVTILMRVLGYADKDSGGVWPIGYINLAKSAGVSAGISLAGGAAITRAQAAQLFVNVLNADAKAGGVYVPANFSRGEKEVTLVSLNGDTLRVSGGDQTKYDLIRASSTSVLNGLKGHLLTNKDGKAAFVPSSGGTTGSAVSNAAVILSKDQSTDGLNALTGGRTDFSVYRNGVLSSVSALRRYDVVTYDAASNILYACDTRVTVYYESCDPSPSAPNSIKVLGGTEFTVLPTAQESLSDFKPGKTMLLLLTSDGNVAGALDPENTTARANAVGVVDAGGRLQMFCGSTMLELSGSYADYSGKVVSISSTKDKVNLSEKSGGASGDLDIREQTLGGRKLAGNVLIYSDGELKSLSEIEELVIPEDRILFARTSGGEIDLIALSSMSSTELYGRVEKVESRQTGDFNGKPVMNRFITIDTGKTTVEKMSGYSVSVGDFVAVTEDDSGMVSVIALKKLGSVSASAWVGTGAVNYGGRTYSVSSEIPIWNHDSKTWFTGENAVEDAIAYGGTMNLYIRGGAVRVIEVRG